MARFSASCDAAARTITITHMMTGERHTYDIGFDIEANPKIFFNSFGQAVVESNLPGDQRVFYAMFDRRPQRAVKIRENPYTASLGGVYQRSSYALNTTGRLLPPATSLVGTTLSVTGLDDDGTVHGEIRYFAEQSAPPAPVQWTLCCRYPTRAEEFVRYGTEARLTVAQGKNTYFDPGSMSQPVKIVPFWEGLYLQFRLPPDQLVSAVYDGEKQDFVAWQNLPAGHDLNLDITVEAEEGVPTGVGGGER